MRAIARVARALGAGRASKIAPPLRSSRRLSSPSPPRSHTPSVAAAAAAARPSAALRWVVYYNAASVARALPFDLLLARDDVLSSSSLRARWMTGARACLSCVE